ncbi:hypothetical protein BC567DRAFT_299683 [Phyllosticta citribraziliensis]
MTTQAAEIGHDWVTVSYEEQHDIILEQCTDEFIARATDTSLQSLALEAAVALSDAVRGLAMSIAGWLDGLRTARIRTQTTILSPNSTRQTRRHYSPPPLNTAYRQRNTTTIISTALFRGHKSGRTFSRWADLFQFAKREQCFQTGDATFNIEIRRTIFTRSPVIIRHTLKRGMHVQDSAHILQRGIMHGMRWLIIFICPCLGPPPLCRLHSCIPSVWNTT